MESSSGVVHGISKGKQCKRNSSNLPSKERTQSCDKCGSIHAKVSCLAMWGTCLKCGEANNFARVCRTSNKRVHEVTEDGYQVSDSLFVETISEDKNHPIKSLWRLSQPDLGVGKFQA